MKGLVTPLYLTSSLGMQVATKFGSYRSLIPSAWPALTGSTAAALLKPFAASSTPHNTRQPLAVCGYLV